MPFAFVNAALRSARQRFERGTGSPLSICAGKCGLQSRSSPPPKTKSLKISPPTGGCFSLTRLLGALINDGEELFEVCDADSAILETAYSTLFDARGETKEELDIEPGWSNLPFIEEVRMESEYAGYEPRRAVDPDGHRGIRLGWAGGRGGKSP